MVMEVPRFLFALFTALQGSVHFVFSLWSLVRLGPSSPRGRSAGMWLAGCVPGRSASSSRGPRCSARRWGDGGWSRGAPSPAVRATADTGWTSSGEEARAGVGAGGPEPALSTHPRITREVVSEEALATELVVGHSSEGRRLKRSVLRHLCDLHDAVLLALLELTRCL